MHFVIIISSTCCNNNNNVNSQIVLLLVCMALGSCVHYTEILKQVCVWLWNKCKCIRSGMIAFSMSSSVIYLFIENENNLCGFIFISIFVFVYSLHAFERRRLWCCLKIELLLCHVTVNWVVKHREVEGCGTFHVNMMSMTQNIMRIWQVFKWIRF